MSKVDKYVLFKDGKKEITFEDLVKQVHSNSTDNRELIREMIAYVGGMIKTPADASMLLPLLSKYMEVLITNDDQLTKLTAILSRMVPKGKGNENFGEILTDKEKEDMMKEVEEALNIKKGNG